MFVSFVGSLIIEAEHSESKSLQSVPSSANLSKTVLNLSELFYFRFIPHHNDIQHNSYTLEDLADHCKVQFDKKMKNEDLACKCIQEICDSVPQTAGLSVFSRRVIPHLQDLCPLVSSSKEVADVIVLSKNEKEFVLMFEVHSSPVGDTLNKAVIGAANILRLLRGDSNRVDEISVFTLPKRDTKWCITETRVVWEGFQFCFQQETFKDKSDGINRIKEVMRVQRHLIPDNINPFLITLTEDEQKKLAHCGGSQAADKNIKQLKSWRHIMVTDGEYVYKLLYGSDRENYRVYQECVACMSSSFLIQHKLKLLQHKLLLSKYKYVKYGPLNVDEAFSCLQQLVIGIKEALDALHGVGLSHNDIRLPNICFDDSFRAVFIDFDMCESKTNLHPLFTRSSSCMYQFPRSLNESEFANLDGIKTDYLQVGWLVAWILLRGKGAYHDRVWLNVKKDIQYSFVHKLVEECHYDEKEIEQLPSETSLESVLLKQSQ